MKASSPLPRGLLLAGLLAAAATLVLRDAGAATAGDELRARLESAGAGATITVEAGDYDGPFVLTKPVRLVGEPGAILRGDKKTHVVAIRAPDVELSGFLIRDSGLSLSDDHAAVHISAPRAIIRNNRVIDSLHGIYVRKAEGCVIENNTIRGAAPTSAKAGVSDPVAAGGLRPAEAELCGVELAQSRRGNGIHLWNSSGHTITGNVITDARDGIYFSFTDRTTARGNSFLRVRYGLHYMYSDENTFENNLFSDNSAGAALMYSKGILLRANRFVANRSQRAYGLLLQSVDDTRVEENEIAGNTLGLYIENGNNCVFARNRVRDNYIGLRLADSSAGNRFFANSFSGNLHPVETSGRNAANAWVVAGRGNHWDGAVALDLDRDGVSDLPHHESDLFGAWRRSFPAIGLLSGSPGERLLRFVHSRLALPGIAGVTDPRPLLQPPAPQP